MHNLRIELEFSIADIRFETFIILPGQHTFPGLNSLFWPFILRSFNFDRGWIFRISSDGQARKYNQTPSRIRTKPFCCSSSHPTHDVPGRLTTSGDLDCHQRESMTFRALDMARVGVTATTESGGEVGTRDRRLGASQACGLEI